MMEINIIKDENDRNKAPSELFNATVIQKKEGIDVTIGSIKQIYLN